jgi:hypothetical protein
MSLEEALSFMPQELYMLCLRSDWKQRVEGLTQLADWLLSHKAEVQGHMHELLLYLKQVSNNWKENNLKVLQSLFSTTTTLLSCGSTDSLQGFLTSDAVEKISESRPRSADCVMAMCRLVSPKEVVKPFINALKALQKPKTSAAALQILVSILEECGVEGLPLQDVIEIAKCSYILPNPLVKGAAEELLTCVYSFIGTKIYPLLAGLKDSQLQTLQAKFANVQAIDFNEESSPERVSAKISAKHIQELSDANWKTRQAAIHSIHQSIKESQSLSAEGLQPLVKALVHRLNDPNKSLVRSCVNLIGDLGASLRSEGNSYSKCLVKALLSCLSDKQSLLRQDVLIAIDQWAGAVGLSKLMNSIANSLLQDSRELLEDMLSWLVTHKEILTPEDCKTLLPSVVALLQNKTQSVRNTAEQLLSFLATKTRGDDIEPFLRTIKPSIAEPIRALTRKLHFEAPREHPVSCEAPSQAPREASRVDPREVPREVPIEGPREPKEVLVLGETGFEAGVYRDVTKVDRERTPTRSSVAQSRPDTIQDKIDGLLSTDIDTVIHSFLGISEWADKGGEFTSWQAIQVTENWLRLFQSHWGKPQTPFFRGIAKMMLKLTQSPHYTHFLDKVSLTQLFRALTSCMNRLILAGLQESEDNLLLYLDFSVLTLLDTCNINLALEVLLDLAIEARTLRDLPGAQVQLNCARKLVDVLHTLQHQVDIDEVLKVMASTADSLDQGEVSQTILKFLFDSLEKINRYFGLKALRPGKLKELAISKNIIRTETPLGEQSSKTFEESKARISLLFQKHNAQPKYGLTMEALQAKVNSLPQSDLNRS